MPAAATVALNPIIAIDANPVGAPAPTNATALTLALALALKQLLRGG